MSIPLGNPRAVVDRLLRDPPVVHAMDFSDDPTLGVWSTDADCYALLADAVRPGMQTLETGAGLSTVLMAALGAHHTCVTPSQQEADRVLDYCRTRSIDVSTLSFAIGCSDVTLPAMSGDLDVVFVDGSHGYPTPMIDWYYGAGRLTAGGLVVLDDTHLPAVAHLAAVLDRDPRWSGVGRSAKWSAWRRLDSGPLGQDWFDQPWLPGPIPTDVIGLAKRVIAHLRRVRSPAR